jgi:hypothetical protein
MIGDDGFVGGIEVLFHRRFEAADTLSDSFAELGQLLTSEHEQRNSEDQQQMRRLQ